MKQAFSGFGCGLALMLVLGCTFASSVFGLDGGDPPDPPPVEEAYAPPLLQESPTATATSAGSVDVNVTELPVTQDARTFTFVNTTSGTVWVGAQNNSDKLSMPLPNNGGWAIASGQSSTITVSLAWGGRFWGRTGCTFDGNGNGTCDTGDCGGKLQCNGAGGRPPVSLAEFTLNAPSIGGTDIYDISLVDGYNVPMVIHVNGGSTRAGDAYWCNDITCLKDLNDTCPAELQVKNAGGKVVACNSACNAFNTDRYCCRGAYNTPETCPPFDYSEAFKAACPAAYSYAYDDTTSTFGCENCNYTIIFGVGNVTANSPNLASVVDTVFDAMKPDAT